MFSYKFLGINQIRPEKTLLLHQIHSNKILTLDQNDKIPQNDQIKADAIITNQKNLIIGVKTADCVPILLFSSTNNAIIAAIHAGWRGAKDNIIKNAVEKMQKLGANIKNIECFIGPCIRQESYQISAEFYDNFMAEDQNFKKFFIKDRSKSGYFLFNLPDFVKEKLKIAGITKINDEFIDTYPSKYYNSYRSFCHGKKDNGRNISYIKLD
ncbi:peptidoglycan editing factor PgeF [Rickettsiales bacterium]|nr:peptidoglycan editing factor PgeF [Rickettsiales bacterium]MDB2550440.1 peptidoglycan editing factor PgeF [Rickettsiales bacterium]